MNEPYIISKMNEFMFRLSEKLSDWLGRRLPKITQDWWEELVINNLTTTQRNAVLTNGVKDITGLDLAMLLRIIDRNWFSITSYFFVNNQVRADIRRMQEIRNFWAHITSNEITKTRVTEDVNVVINLMGAFEASVKETLDMERFILDVEEDKELQSEEIKTEGKGLKQEGKEQGRIIEVGSLVTLVSDDTKIGAVISKTGNNYLILIDGKVENFYGEQIKLKEEEERTEKVSLERMKTAVTAYQINNPGSSNLYSLNSARIDFVPYQFRPALKIIKADLPRILIADDVGVGKTIEAGLILKELEARSNINSVLVICPRPLVAERKWELEMKRFDETFTALTSRDFVEAIMETDRDGEWPERYSKAIIPYSLFSEDMIMGTQSKTARKKKNLGLSELDPLPHFDLVIVDEAHNIRNSNTWMYSGVELFCRNADAVAFLTATPLQNSNNDLYTLLNLLRPDIVTDKDTFSTMSEPNKFVNNLLRIVRQQQDGWQDAAKEEMNNILGTTWGRNVIQHSPDFEDVYNSLDKGAVTRDEKVEMITKIEGLHSFDGIINRTRRKDIEDFCIRRNQTVKVPYNSAQRELYDALMDFEEKSLAMLHGNRSVRFMMCTIMRQASSCIYGLVPFLNDILASRLSQIQEDGELYEYNFEMNDEDENYLFELADEISILAEELPENDPKFDRMFEIIQGKMKEENNRVIVFSSFRHTLAYIHGKLEKAGIRVGQIDGSVPDEERFKLRERFMAGRDDPEAIDVLLFSEVGGEGLDYQFCDSMINYDLPWNPMRIEQRIGRIDRRGQQADTVRIYNMITENTIDEVVYDRCLSKIGVFEDSIGDCSEILGGISEQIMKIMFDPNLTEQERETKIEQMADNDVLEIQEMHRLEQDEKSLYGFDLSNYIQNKDVQDAENMWISPQSIQNLVKTFLNDFLGEGEYIRGKSDLKSLRLSNEKRAALLDNLKSIHIVNNNYASKLWTAYLKSDKPTLQITFDSECAKDNRDVAFLTQMYPLVIQAAVYESNELPCEVGISYATNDVEPGDYRFLIYVWKYVGIRPDIRLIAVCENDIVQKNVLNYIQFCDEYDYKDNLFEDNWDELDQLHYKKWQIEKNEFAKTVTNDCNYRLDQLRHSYNRRSAIFRDQIQNAEDEKIKRMRKSQLDKLTSDFERQEGQMKETIDHVDIHTNLQVKGILHVVGEGN